MKAPVEMITGGTVLVVGDEPDLCLLMKTYLLRKSCRVLIVHTFQDALKSPGQVLPDAVLVFHSSYKRAAVTVESILQRAPGVQLITCNNEVVYSKHC